ncbi:hypothetical protein OAL55_05810 [Verrucomicrobiales bacterium]|nr:hypothetical protein [Verrucomicrobiales bacterium]
MKLQLSSIFNPASMTDPVSPLPETEFHQMKSHRKMGPIAAIVLALYVAA